MPCSYRGALKYFEVLDWKNQGNNSPAAFSQRCWIKVKFALRRCIDIISRIFRWRALQEGRCERSARFAALFSTRRGEFRFLHPLPCSPASTSPVEGQHDGLLEGSCGRVAQKNAKPAKRRHVHARIRVWSAHPKAVWEKTSIVHTTTDRSMICEASIIRWLFAQNVRRQVQCRQFATHTTLSQNLVTDCTLILNLNGLSISGQCNVVCWSRHVFLRGLDNPTEIFCYWRNQATEASI